MTQLGTINSATDLISSLISDFDERVRDVMGTALVAGANVTLTVNDPGDTITITSTGGGGGGGSVATDTLWNAKGDLAVGTGADLAAPLTVGANGTMLVADSTQTTGVKWTGANMLFDSNSRLTLAATGASAGLAISPDNHLFQSATGQLQLRRLSATNSFIIFELNNNATTTPGQVARISYMDAGVTQWWWEKDGTNHLRAVDGVSAGNPRAISMNISGTAGPKVGFGVDTPTTYRVAINHTSLTDWAFNSSHNAVAPTGDPLFAAGARVTQQVTNPAGSSSGSPSGFATVGRGLWVISTTGAGGTGGYGSVVGLGVDCNIVDVVAGANGNNSEFAYFIGVVTDQSATGKGHGRLWGADTSVHTSVSGETNSMVANIVAFINQYHSATPTVAPSTGISSTTRKGYGGGNAAFSELGGAAATLNTFPIDYAFHAHGCATSGGTLGAVWMDGTRTYGHLIGYKVGGSRGGIWWDTFSDYSMTKYGVHIEDWGQAGVYIGRRYVNPTPTETGSAALMVGPPLATVTGPSLSTMALYGVNSDGSIASVALTPGTTPGIRGIQMLGTYTITGEPAASSYIGITVSPTINLSATLTSDTNQVIAYSTTMSFTLTSGAGAYNITSAATEHHVSYNASFSYAAGGGGSIASPQGWSVAFKALPNTLVDTGWTLGGANGGMVGLQISAPTGAGTITSLIGVDIQSLEAFDAGTGTTTNPAIGVRSMSPLLITDTANDVLSANNSIALEIKSTTRALRFNSMTTTQRSAMNNLVGMVIFNTTTGKLEVCTTAGTGGAEVYAPLN